MKPTKEELRGMYIDEGMKLEEIGKIYGLCRTTIYRLLTRLNIEIPEDRRRHIKLSRPPKEELRRMYVDERMSVAKIKNRLKVSNVTVLKWLRESDLQVREPPKRFPAGFVKPTGGELRRMYIDEGMSIPQIKERFAVSTGSVYNWFKEDGIKIMPGRRAPRRRKHVLSTPVVSEEELRRLYITERMSAIEIGKKLGISDKSVYKLLQNYKIETRNLSDAQLPEGIKKPTGEELRRMYIDEGMSLVDLGKKLGVSPRTALRWLRKEEIKTRKPSRFPEGYQKPTEAELSRMYYDEKLTAREIAKIYRTTERGVYKWLRKHNLRARREHKAYTKRGERRISDFEFKEFIKKDKSFQNLAGAAMLMNGKRNDIESIIFEMYGGKFKEREELHNLLENNKLEIYNLIQNGVTNLGVYIGNFELEKRRIIPVLIGESLITISPEKLTTSLEEKIVRILKSQYSPDFNIVPKKILSELEKKIENHEGKVKEIYQTLYKHYQEVLQLKEELE